jgi:hypothetical protein
MGQTGSLILYIGVVTIYTLNFVHSFVHFYFLVVYLTILPVPQIIRRRMTG